MYIRLAISLLLLVRASVGYYPPNALKLGAASLQSAWSSPLSRRHKHHRHHSRSHNHNHSHHRSSSNYDGRSALPCFCRVYGNANKRAMRSRTTSTTCTATAAHGSHSSGTLHNSRHVAAGNHTVDSRRSYTKFGNADGNGKREREAGRRRGGISSRAISGTMAEGRVAVDGRGRGGAGRGGGGERGVRGDEKRSGKKSPRVKPPLPPPLTQRLNVVLTHTTADFDTLAAAVGLAKLWQKERPEDETCVCIPRGTHPVVRRFLALHKNLFPLKALKDLDHNRVFRVGLVDAQRLDRVGAAAPLVLNATEVHVVDHHNEQTSDINATEVIIEKVGSVSTIITERLQLQDLDVKPAEATLLALGVHSDTGSLTFDSATSRDAAALAWLMEQGASQQAIAEYGHAALSPEQQTTLTECINNLNRTSLNGATVATAVVQLDGYVNGMAAVAQNVLDVTDSDVFILGAYFPQRRGTHMVIIGRARPRVSAVNLDALMSAYGGGGHRKAAAASLRLDGSALPGGQPTTPEAVVQDLVDRIFIEQIKELEVAEDIMTAPVKTCRPVETMEEVAATLAWLDIRGMPVMDEDTGKVLGLISCREVEKVTRLGRGSELVKGWMKEQFPVADVRDPIHEIEALFIKEDLGRLPVFSDGKLEGIITRTDILRQHRFYEGLHYHNRAFAAPVDSPRRKFLARLRKHLKKYDVD